MDWFQTYPPQWGSVSFSPFAYEFPYGEPSLRSSSGIPGVDAAFLSTLLESIQDELDAAELYRELMKLAPDEEQRKHIEHAFNDEQKHYRMFSDLYRRLTSTEPSAVSKSVPVTDYREGLRNAFNAELQAVETYRDMMLKTRDPEIRDIFFEAMTDEMEHAMRFSFLFSNPTL